jgi:hypothetical protein
MHPHHVVPDALSQLIASEAKIEDGLHAFCKRVKSDLRDLTDYHLDEDGLLYRKDRGGAPSLVVSEKSVPRLIRDHDTKYAAHARVKKTQQWLRWRYYWSSLHKKKSKVVTRVLT